MPPVALASSLWTCWVSCRPEQIHKRPGASQREAAKDGFCTTRARTTFSNLREKHFSELHILYTVVGKWQSGPHLCVRHVATHWRGQGGQNADRGRYGKQRG